MIDVESTIFNDLYDKIIAEYPDALIVSEYVASPTSFPCISIIETNNTTLERTLTTTGEEHAEITYEINVYSNKKSGKKSECKNIISLIDSTLLELNFTRIMLNNIPNLNDSTIYRMVGRYEAVVSNNNVIYRR